MTALPRSAAPQARAGYAAILAQPARALLAFDYDGVIAPIVADPQQAVAHPATLTALRQLAGRVGTLAVITGRPAAVVASLGRFTDYPELVDLIVFGHYGRERMRVGSGQVLAPPPDPGVAAVRVEVPAVVSRLGMSAEVRVEDKGSAVAVHTRRASDPAAAFAQLVRPLGDLAQQHGLIVEPGRQVLELRPPGADKGAALRTLVTERAAGAVLYAGDDLGDLPAFATVAALREEGVPGLSVCSASAEAAEVARRADLVVNGPAGIATLLHDLAAAL